MRHVKYWEIIADNLSNAGWSWGRVSAIDSNGRTIWIADARRGDGKRFVVRADEKLTAFMELESAIRAASWLDKPWPVKAGSVARHSQTISNGRSKLKHGWP
jgi:hypothetical protein